MSMFSDVVGRTSIGVIHINILGPDGQRLGSGSGFLLRGYLITNNHVIRAPEDSVILLRTARHKRDDPKDGIRLPYQEFIGRLIAGSEVDAYDYAILDVPELTALGLHQYDFHRIITPSIGDEVVILGFPLDHLNLTCHRGVISSFYQSGKASVIQLDASVNNGNSGGPLLDLHDGNVIGIITRKNTGLTRMFEKFTEVLDANIKLLQGNQGGVYLQGVNVSATLLENQKQTRTLCDEILRSANTGIGYAFSVAHIAQENVLQ